MITAEVERPDGTFRTIKGTYMEVQSLVSGVIERGGNVYKVLDQKGRDISQAVFDALEGPSDTR